MKDQATENALTLGKNSITDGNIVVGRSDDMTSPHAFLAIAFSNTVCCENMLVQIRPADARALVGLLTKALAVGGIWSVDKSGPWQPGEYRVLGQLGNGAQVIEAQGSLENMTIIAEALNAAGAKP